MRVGVWLPADATATLSVVDRHAALVHATALSHPSGDDLQFARESAAAVWGMPRITPWPRTVRHLVTRRGVSGSSVLRPFLGGEAGCSQVHGLRVTSPARTVVDLGRTGKLEDAVAAADHCLRHRLCTAEELAVEVALIAPGAPGRTRARAVVELADGLSMSPGESLSRVQMFRLRIPRPRLQVRLSDAAGHIGDVDFWWRGVVGEFDGRTKYRLPPGASHEEAGRVLWAEKKREDRLRRQAEVARWVWADLARSQRLLTILGEKGIRPERRSTWIDLAHRSGTA